MQEAIAILRSIGHREAWPASNEPVFVDVCVAFGDFGAASLALRINNAHHFPPSCWPMVARTAQSALDATWMA